MANKFKVRKGLIVNGSGSTGDETILDIQGNQGQLFSITDQLSGSLFSVNDISGIPILEVFSDDTVVMGTFGDNTLVVTGSNVGIGTTSPSNQLHVYSTGNGEIKVERASGAQLLFQAQSAAGVVGTNSNHDLDLKTNGSTRIKVENTGNVGIGTTSPGETLEVAGNIRLGDGAARDIIGPTNENLRILANPNSSTEGIIFSTDGGSTTEMFIQDGGNVGINMTSPISSLHIGDGNDTISSALYSTDIVNISAQNTAPGFNIISAGSSEFNRGVFKATRSRGTLASPTAAINGDYVFSLLGAVYDGTSNYATAGVEMRADGTVSSGNAPQRIEFQTGLTTSRSTRMTIKSNGNVGINTTSPGTDLDVNGDITTDNLYLATNIIHEGDTNTTIGFGTDTINLSTAGNTRLSAGSTGTITLGAYGSGTKTGTAAYTLAVDSSGNIIETSGGGGGESFQDVTDTGNTTTNDITIGASSTPTATLNVVGNGTGDTTDALLVENSGLTDLFKITDSGNFYMKHATRTNSIIINNNDTTGTGASCTLIGNNAGYGTNLNGSFLTAVGLNAANTATGGGSSVAIGGYAAYGCGNLFSTVAIGNNAGRGAGNAYFNVAIGAEACKDSSIRYSVCIGGYAGRGTGSSLQDRNVYIGYQTAYNSNLNDGNTVIGARLQSSSTEGLSNTVIIGSDNAERLRIDSTGKFKFDSYGAGSFTGTQTVNLEADSSGNVIERLEERGTFSGTTDSITGQLTISHGLGEIPSFVMLTMDDYSNSATYSSVISKTSTTVTIVNPNRGVTVSGYYIFSN